MSHSLLDLPLELLLKIIEELAPLNDEICKDQHYQNQPQDRDRNYRYIPLMPWSCTSSFFRNLLAPYIFKSVELRNEDDCGASLNALAGSQHAHLIKEINYYGSAPTYAGEATEDLGFSDTVGILPETVATALSNLRCFPCLELLSIEFSYNFDDMSEGLDLCRQEEWEEEIRIVEEAEAWRALMAKTYKALAKNKNVYTKGLDLRDLIYKRPSTFTGQSFHDFLSHIETFSLSIRGEDNGAGWCVNKAEEYVAFASKLDVFFYDHLSHVKSVTIKAPEEGPLGQPGDHTYSQIPLGLKKDQMPFLKHLHLEYIIICPQMTDLLIGHTATLENLSLRECFVSMMGTVEGSEADGGIYWEHFLNTLSDANFEKLRRVEILPLDLPLLLGVHISGYETRVEDTDDVLCKTRQLIQDSDSSRRLFAYCFMDEKYGNIYPDEDGVLNSFRRGKDQASYDRLMHKVDTITAKADMQ